MNVVDWEVATLEKELPRMTGLGAERWWGNLAGFGVVFNLIFERGICWQFRDVALWMIVETFASVD